MPPELEGQDSLSAAAAAAGASTTADVNQSADSSTASQTQDANADSSTAQQQQGAKGNEQPSLLDSVKEALKAGAADVEGKDGKDGESPASKGKTDAAAESNKDATKQQDGKQDKDAKPQRHKTAEERIKELVADNKQLKEQNAALNSLFDGVDPKDIPAVVSQLRERATAFDNFSTWVQESGLNYEQVVSGMSILRIIATGDPAEALKVVSPIYNDLLLKAGERLPDDLQTRVDNGEIGEDLAKELARERSKARNLETRVTARTEADAEANHQRAVENYAKSIETAVARWESEWKTRDPDYSKKQRFVTLRLREMMGAEAQAGQQLSPKRVVELAQAARDEIEREFATILPAKTEIKTVTGGAGKDAIPQPKSSLDAARAAATGQRVTY